jgi:hypothetical protein
MQTGPWRAVGWILFHPKAKNPARLKSITSRKIFQRHRLSVWVETVYFVTGILKDSVETFHAMLYNF